MHEATGRLHEILAAVFPTCVLDWTAEQGADELATAYESIGLAEGELHGERYIRLGRLRRLLDDGLLVEGLRWA